MKTLSEITESTPAVLKGTLVFKNTRVPVANLFTHIAKGKALHHFVSQYPAIDIDEAAMVLRHARISTMGIEDQIAPNLAKFPIDELFTFLIFDLSLGDFITHFPLSAKEQVKQILFFAEKKVLMEAMQ